jgi:hypothetical protein
MLVQVPLSPYPSSAIADTQTAVPIALSSANSAGGISTRPATTEANERTTGSALATGTAQMPRPARNRSARSMSAWVISR